MSQETKEIYEFGPFRLDVDEHSLVRTDGRRIGSLPEKAFKTLCLLVRNRGHLLSKQDILHSVWPDSFVEENNVDKCIYAIRHALSEKPGEQHYIETVRKHGYRFVGHVRCVGEEPPALLEPAAPVSNAATPPPADHTSPEVGRRRPSFIWAIPAGIVPVMIVAGFVGFRYLRPMERSVAPPQVAQRRLTVEGGVTRVAMSRDGRYAAIVQNASIVLFDLQNGGQRTLVPASGQIRILSIAFTPDNTAIYYGTRPDPNAVTTIYTIPTSGGQPAKILDDIYGPVTFSPDGKRIAFVRRYSELNEWVLLTANVDGSNLAKLASSRQPNNFDGTPSWSPDGAKIAVSAISNDEGFHYRIALIDATSGETNYVPDQRWTLINSLVWLSDSTTLLLAGQEGRAVNSQVWRLDTSTGQASHITDDYFFYESITGATDGRSIVAAKVRQTSHVWIIGDQNRQLTAGFDNHDGARGVAWGPNGDIYYHSRASGHDAIWRMNQDGSAGTEVTPDTAGGFAVSPDGRWLVFQAKQSSEHLGLQIRDLAGDSENPLTANITAVYPAFFPDSKRIIYSVFGDKLALYQTTITGREHVPVSQEYRWKWSPAVSPSGRFIAFAFSRAEASSLQRGVAVIDAATRQIIASHPAQISSESRYENPTIQWSADESEIYFIQLNNSVSNIMRVRLADGAISNLTNFTDGRIFNFAIEPGGTRILIARGQVERDAVLLNVDPNL